MGGGDVGERASQALDAGGLWGEAAERNKHWAPPVLESVSFDLCLDLFLHDTSYTFCYN